MTPDKTPLPVLLMMILALMLSGCAGNGAGRTGNGVDRGGGNLTAGNPSNQGRNATRKSGEIIVAADGISGLDLGEDWQNPSRRDRLNATPAPGSSINSVPISSREGGGEASWTIVLFTYTRSDHRLLADEAARRIRQLGADFSTVRRHTSKKGSMVVFGNYLDNKAPRAQADLARLRGLARDGRRIFPRVMLTRLESEAGSGQMLANDLRNVRVRYPNVHTLYTLDVAVWITPEDGSLRFETLKREAEAYCRQLRAQGHEAYFHHNEIAKVSNVTIGVFGSGAVDAQSGIYSMGVMDAMRTFPARMNNGQPLLVPLDRYHPERGTRPQSPVLVAIPE